MAPHTLLLRRTLAATLFVCIGGSAIAQTQTAITPADRLKEAWWAKRHDQIVEQIKANPTAGLVMLGDSITQNYENFQSTWQRFYASRTALNLGFSGDQTQHVLWRLDHGEIDGIRPRAVVLLIGTNNTGGGQTAAETEAGIDAVVDTLRQKLPQAAIVLLGILPTHTSEKKAAADREVNQYLGRKYESDAKITYLDLAPAFYKDGKLDTSLYSDPLHPDSAGQLRMAEAIEPTLAKLLGDGQKQYLNSLSDVNTAVLPVPRLEMDSYDWYERHKDVLAAKAQMDPQVVLVGDSITHFWGGPPKAARVSGALSWQQAFGGMQVLNLGFGWDRTQNVLWRLSHGEFEGLHPKTVVLNIGTNNLTGTGNARTNTPAEVVQGIVAIVDLVHAQSPESRVIVMGVFPRGFGANTPGRAAITQVNLLAAKALAGKAKTEFLDIGAKFLDADGTLPKTLMGDGTHPTEEGYKIWAAALMAAGVGR